MKIGLDFGTTTCTVGRLRRDGGRAIHPPIPSIGAWRNGELVFGKKARELLRTPATDVHPIRDLKLMLGSDRKIVIGQTVLEPEDVAAELIQHLIREADLGDAADGAVIGTPVQVTLEHRRALRRAALKAGLKDVTFVYEPTAALIGARRFAAPERGGLTLVVDWGGGTLDIAVIETDGTKFREVAVGGDVAELGGTCIDRKIAHHVLDQNVALRSAVSRIDGGEQRLYDEVEEMKLEILDSLEGEEGPPEQHAPQWLEQVIRLDRSVVFDALRHFAMLASDTIMRKLTASGIRASQVTHILFAGGVCQAAEMRQRIGQEFPNARQRTTVADSEEPLRLQELTGAGCVEITGRDVIPELAANLGVRQSDGSVCVILPQGFPLRVNTFRRADFLITDPDADEAVLDLGLLHQSEGKINMMAASDQGFETLRQIFVPSGGCHAYGTTTVVDHLEVRVGIDTDLTVSLSASSRMARRTVRISQSGVPLVLNFR